MKFIGANMIIVTKLRTKNDQIWFNVQIYIL
jgi:hypothetical protein